MLTKQRKSEQQEKMAAAINLRSFVTVAVILVVMLLFCGSLSYFIPQGSFLRDASGNILPDTYVAGEIKGIAPWRVFTAPVRVFASADALTIIMIRVFLLVLSGVFHLLQETGGIKIFIVRILRHLRDKGGPVVCMTALTFMLFGSLFGMFEELVTLLPLIVVFMLSMQLDTMVGLGVCLMAACFGFSAAITNPFSVGTAAQLAGIHVSDGVWLRVLFFGLVYAIVCLFLMRYIKKIQNDPQASLTYDIDQQKRKVLLDAKDELPENHQRVFGIYSVFFAVQGVLLLAIACIRSISGLAIPILAAGFLVGGLVAGKLVCNSFKSTLRYFAKGAASMLPAVAMIALASSVKLVMDESHIIDTVMNAVLGVLQNQGKIVTVLLIYALILFLQLFIGSASAKIFLVMPMVLPVTAALGISPTLVILTYCMADGFTDVILPTNPVLLIGLSMANVSYGKWLKWTWKLQLLLFAVSVLVLFLGVHIGY